MIKLNLTINDKPQQATMPGGWHELTCAQYAAHNRLTDPQPLDTLAILTGIDKDLLLLVPTNDILTLYGYLHWMTELPKEPYIGDTFVFQGIEHNIPKDLGLEPSGADQLARQALKDYPLFEALPIVLAQFCRPTTRKKNFLRKWGKPVIEKYSFEGAEARAELFKGLDVDTAYRVGSFFLSTLLGFSNSIQYLLRANTKERKSWRVILTSAIGTAFRLR